ncbi:peroxisomal biogenesis factor 3 [Planoprotostelium fungivorum]|uniref:Peroxisomal biogenesis factor 3 n=1 Tax=Planoprotostelium fungivorum TaxID=1890364 RepID=A0A2P6NYK4_9EUKA|nr:peroxisomal biogenesis factor 3 [Planoprotostelium fungivorum]
MLEDLAGLLGDSTQWTVANLYIVGQKLQQTGSSVGAWVHKHRRKLIVVGILTGSGFLAIRFIKYKINQFKISFEKQQKEFDKMRMKNYFDSAQKSCDASVINFIEHALRNRLNTAVEIPSAQAVRQIESKEEKLAQWEKIKVGSFTKALLTLYTVTLLTLFVRVEVNILGRYVYMNTAISVTDEGDDQMPVEEPIPDAITKKYLAHTEYLIEEGLPELAEFITSQVEEEMTAWPVTGKYNTEHLSALLANLRNRIDFLPGGMQRRPLYPYLLPVEEDLIEESLPEQLQCLLNETRDVTESEKFGNILGVMLDQACSSLLNGISAAYQTSNQVNNGLMAMPHIIPILRDQASKLIDEKVPENVLWPLFKNQQVEEYSYYIFTSSYDQE